MSDEQIKVTATRREAYDGSFDIARTETVVSAFVADELLRALVTVVAIADRKTDEFDQARAAIARARPAPYSGHDGRSAGAAVSARYIGRGR